MPDTTELLRRLVRIDSINPKLVPGAAGEGNIAEFIREWLVSCGVEASIEDTAEIGRPNVVGRVAGTGNGPTLLLNAHMDTVGIEAMEDPFEARIESGRLYGRGALDTKGGLAAAMSAMSLLAGSPGSGDVILTAVVDEEHASAGTTATTRLEADAAIVFEPSDLTIITTHKGFVWLDVEVVGRAAHGSRPDLGIDAITKASKIITELDRINDDFAQLPPVEHLTRPSIHSSLIRGGQERSSYADRCTFGLEIRTHPSTTAEEMTALVESRIEALSAEDPELSAAVDLVLERRGLSPDPSSPLVSVLEQAMSEVLGAPAGIGGHDGWMDSAILAEAGIPAVVFGPSGEGLHAAVEWVDLRSVELCRDVTVRAARLFGASQPVS